MNAQTAVQNSTAVQQFHCKGRRDAWKMTRVDEYLFKNSLKKLKGICEVAFMEEAARDAALAELNAMIKILESDQGKKND